MLFLANTGLRPDEAKNLQHRDVKVVTSDETGKTHSRNRSARQTRYRVLQEQIGGRSPISALLRRAKPLPKPKKDELIEVDPKPSFPEPTDHVFPGNHVKLFNGVLRRAKLKLDRDDNRRTGIQLAAYVYMYALDGGRRHIPDRQELRTSVEMIEKFYAAHLKNTLSDAAINVMKPKRTISRVRSKNISPQEVHTV